jgi:hypothetical protein
MLNIFLYTMVYIVSARVLLRFVASFDLLSLLEPCFGVVDDECGCNSIRV